ncbi:hypothetical protein [Nocardiopsis trehalosi]|uniref:hypothetical protein n=1 Tax=Nocardiopsis trehalosi TaxID=109329 RepID=UPI0008303CDA|nr:hypothetical protein [Nocardiopsis trehalosi]
MWSHLRERDRCPGCGTRHAEWSEAEGGSRRAYTAEIQRCLGCEQIEQRRDSLKREDDLGKGVHIVLQRNPQRQ